MKNLDCFAMLNHTCRALSITHCEDCAFYCPEAEMRRRREASDTRLRRLNHSTQKYIADKYYGGRMIWRKEVPV